MYTLYYSKKNYVNLWVSKNAIKMFALSLKKYIKYDISNFLYKNQPYILFYESVKKPCAYVLLFKIIHFK